MNNKYKPIIGLEIHVELNTKTKMFCRCTTAELGEKPNTHTCPVCLGLPGALPYPNQKAIEWCLMIGLALNCKAALFSKFDRKNYFYPDLSKGYQISQYDLPLSTDGYLEIEQGKKIGIRRVHQEEDTGKIIHGIVNDEKVSLLDFNRSGIPLVEIVTEPDISSGKEAKDFLTKLQRIIRYLGVSDADMEKGHMRLEPNISLQKIGETALPDYKVEVKNINSFRFVEKAIDYEIKRQTELLEKGEKPAQETRGWDEIRSKTVPQRVKEEAHDYRYFPDPDLPPMELSEKQIDDIKNQIPELQENKIERFKKEYSLPFYDVDILTREKELADYFEKAVKAGKEQNITPKQIANYIINKKVDTNTVLPGEVVKTIISTSQIAKIDEATLAKIIEKVLNENQKAIEDYKKGKEQVLMFLIGQVMRNLKEKIDINIVKENLINHIKNDNRRT